MTAADAHYDVFISYSHADADWVWNWLWPRLEAAGLHVCLDRRDFDIGVPSLVNMERAVDHSRHTLLVLTPAWVASEWTAFEQLLTQTEDPAGRRRRLLPLLLQPCQPPRRIAMLTYADFTRREAWDAELPRVIAAVQGKLQLPEVGPRLDQQPRLSPEQHNRQPRAAHTPIPLRRATYHFSIGLILGILLLGGVGWIAMWAPEALPAGPYHILGLSLALLASLFVFCVTRNLGSEAQPRKSPLGMIDAQAIGSLALFIVVLVWWWSPLAPLGIETNATEKAALRPDPALPPALKPGMIQFSQYQEGQFLNGDEFTSQNIQQIQSAPSGHECHNARVAILPPGSYRSQSSFLSTAAPDNLKRCNTVPVSIHFVNPVREIVLHFGGAHVPYELRAYDKNGSVISSKTEKAASYVYADYEISLAVDTANIVWVEFGYETALTMIRDIEFRQ